MKKTKKIWILKTLYGKHLLIFRNTWYSNLKILYVSTSYIFVLEAVPLLLLKIELDMQSQFSPIWQIFLPVYHQPSKRASCFISNLENLASTKVHRANFTSEMLGTFFWCQHSFATVVESACYSVGFNGGNMVKKIFKVD